MNKIGDTVEVDGVEYEVLWCGGEGLVPDRITKLTGFWTPPKRLYNKRSEYWLKSRKKGAESGGEEAVLRRGDPNEDLEPYCGSNLEETGAADS